MATKKGNTTALQCEKTKGAETLLYGAIQNIQAARQVARTVSQSVASDNRAVYGLESLVTMLSVIGFKTESAMHLIEHEKSPGIVGDADDWLLDDNERDALDAARTVGMKGGAE